LLGTTSISAGCGPRKYLTQFELSTRSKHTTQDVSGPRTWTKEMKTTHRIMLFTVNIGIMT